MAPGWTIRAIHSACPSGADRITPDTIGRFYNKNRPAWALQLAQNGISCAKNSSIPDFAVSIVAVISEN
jgi:hypothetical protein